MIPILIEDNSKMMVIIPGFSCGLAVDGLLLNVQSDAVCGSRAPADGAVFYPRRNAHKSWHGVIKELLIAFAEIVLSNLDIEPCSVFHAAAPADIEMPANQAFVAELFFVPCERPFCLAGGELLYRRLEDISQTPLRFDEKLTAESVAGVLDDNEAGALLAVSANRMFVQDVVCHQGIEIADIELFRPIPEPEIEQFA
jgi:hypothetical protein